MMIRSLRLRLGMLFLAFLLLVIAAVAVTYAAIASQRHDAVLINLAGRQRMLSQQMTWLALASPHDPLLAANRQRFVETLTALEQGGAALDGSGQLVVLPPPDDEAVRRALADARQAWLRFDGELGRGAVGEAGASLTTISLALLDALDRAVARLAAQAEAKVQRLQIIQVTFLLAALLLLWLGYRVTQRHVVNPLAELGASAGRMGASDFESKVPTFADDELRRLAAAFDALRAEVLASQRKLEARVRQRTQELTTAFEFSQEIAAQLELTQLLDSVTDRARTLMVGSAAALCLLDEEATALQLAAGSGAGVANPALLGTTAMSPVHLLPDCMRCRASSTGRRQCVTVLAGNASRGRQCITASPNPPDWAARGRIGQIMTQILSLYSIFNVQNPG